MKISFVIPAYNEENVIGGCIESIREAAKNESFSAVQDKPHDIEIIVANNNSKDGTHAAAAKYPGVIVVDELQKGTNHARQAGFLRSSGDLIANVDADNRLPPGWITRAFSEFEKNPKLAALSGPYIFYDLPVFSRAVLWLCYFLAAPVYIVSNRILGRGNVVGGNVVIRRSALLTVGGYNTELTFFGDDTDTAMRLSKVGIVKFSYTFTIFASGRRMLEQGLWHALYLYIMNYLWTALFRKPFTKKAKDVRIAKQ